MRRGHYRAGSRLWVGFATIFVAAPLSIGGPEFDITQVGLTGAMYVYNGSPSSYALQMNTSGQVTGTANRYDAAGDSLGEDVWFYNGASTTQVGFVGPDYSYIETNSSGTALGAFERSFVNDMNSAGEVIGGSSRYDASGDPLGGDAWLFDGSTLQQLGLSGLVYQYQGADGTLRGSNARQLNDAGQVIGGSDRFDASGDSLGTDAWLYDGSTTVQLGLTGAGYSYADASADGGTYEFSEPREINQAGLVIGYSRRFDQSGNALGTDAWLYSGGLYQLLGLTGSVYSGTTVTGGTYRDSSPGGFNSAGQVIGVTGRYDASANSLGRDAYFFNGKTTQQIGLTGSDYRYLVNGNTYESSVATRLSDAGQVYGASQRYNASGASLGQDEWAFNGSTTQLIGLTDSNHSYAYTGTGGGTFRSSDAYGINNSGQVIGTSNRFDARGDALGQDAWIFDGAATRQIGLAGGVFSSANPYDSSEITQNSTPVDINAAGDVIGFSQRFGDLESSLGESAWFYDAATQTTIPLIFSTDPTNQYSFSDPTVLTNAGDVLGSYELFSASGIDEGSHGFLWSESSGFEDLGALVRGGLMSQGWQSISGPYGSFIGDQIAASADGSGIPQYILGEGQILGHTADQSIYELSEVPEPASFLVLGIAGALAAMRRPRAQRVSHQFCHIWR